MNNEFNFLIYRSVEEELSVNALVKDETIWLTQKAMAELFGCGTDNISLHLKNIFKEGELDENSTTEEISVVQTEGSRQVKRTPKFYSLDAIISVGYRVNSGRATRFRIWATSVLKEYMTKGFVVDDERLKQGKTLFGKDYFRELLETVRSIRTSERRIWEQITDIFDAKTLAEYEVVDSFELLEEQILTNTRDEEFYYLSTNKEDVEIPIPEDLDPEHLLDHVFFGNIKEYTIEDDQLKTIMAGNITYADFAGEYVITYEFQGDKFIFGEMSEFIKYIQ